MKARALGEISQHKKSEGLRLRLKKDVIIPRGTIMESDGCTKVQYFRPEEDVSYIIPFGNNACGTLRIGTEIGDKQFDQWFEEAK